MTTLEHYPAQIAEHATATCDAEGCRALWWAVIEQTAKDIAYLERFRGSGQLAKHELERVRRIAESPPGEFVEDDWFGVVCEYVGLPAEGVRGWLLPPSERTGAMKIGMSNNENGTPVSVHICPDCGEHFTVCPPAGDDWGGCQAPECASYDESRDADKLFDDPDAKIVRESIN